jgi:hypothetical protein
MRTWPRRSRSAFIKRLMAACVRMDETVAREYLESSIVDAAEDAVDHSTRAPGAGEKQYFLTLPKSEACVIAGIAAASDEQGLEGGGELYGLLSQGGRPVVLLVTGPSPGATRSPTFFRQAPEFRRRTQDAIGRTFGLQLVGTYHHHTIDLPHPSRYDVEQCQSFTARNRLNHWAQIITTVHGNGGRRLFNRPRCQGARQASSLRIAIHASQFTDPQRGEKKNVPLRILAGMSPMRLAVLSSGVLAPADIGQSYCDFPMDRIVYTPFDFDARYPQPRAQIPESLDLVEHLQELPERVQHGVQIRVDTRRNLVVVLLPLPDGSRARIAYTRRATHLIDSISLNQHDGEVVQDEISAHFVGQPSIPLKQIYETLVSRSQKVTEEVRHSEPEDSIPTVLQEQE